MASVFADILKAYIISRGVSTQNAIDPDEFGNPRFSVEMQELAVSLHATNRDALVRQFGADEKTHVMIGECLEPAVLPENVMVGATFDCAWRGPGRLTVVQIVQDPLELEPILGSTFYATWQSKAPSDAPEIFDNVFSGAVYG